MKRCCCFSLRTGGIIIGVLDLIGAIVGTIACIFMITYFSVLTAELAEVAKSKNDTLALDNAANSENTPPSKTDPEKAAVIALAFLVLTIIFYISLILCIVQIVIASILLHGIRKQTPSFLKVWTIFKIVFLVISVIGYIAIMATRGFTFLSLIEWLLAIAINIFFIKVIADLRSEMTSLEIGNAQYSNKA